MRPETRRLHRLRFETMDWCRNQSEGHDVPLRAYEQSVQWSPEVWDQ